MRYNNKVDCSSAVDVISKVNENRNYNSLIERMKANKCEYCGAITEDIEIHHVKKLKDLKGKKMWEVQMIARKRKTLALCHDCHVKLHNGMLD